MIVIHLFLTFLTSAFFLGARSSMLWGRARPQGVRKRPRRATKPARAA